MSVLLSAGIVLVYTYLGGLTSAIYNEVLQFFLIVAGFVPLVIIGLKDVGGWSGLQARLATESVARGFDPGALTESWQHMGNPAANPMGVEWFGLVMGLGFVLSFGYWCTDFLVVQRAMAADSMNSARRTPLIAALPKMVFPFLVILPGMIAISVAAPSDTALARSTPPAYRLETTAQAGAPTALPVMQRSLIPPKLDDKGNPIVGTDGRVALDYDLAIPQMLCRYFPAGHAGARPLRADGVVHVGHGGQHHRVQHGVDVRHLPELHQAAARPTRTTSRMGTCRDRLRDPDFNRRRVCRAPFNNIMDLLQLVFAFVNAPLFATFMLGMFWKRTTGHGAFTGLLAGTLAAALHHGLTLPVGAVAGVKGGWLAQAVHTYPSEMAQNFWTAIFAWTTCFVVTIAGVALHRAEAGRGTERARLRPDADSSRSQPAVAQAPGRARDDCAGADAVAECDLLVVGSRQ